MLLSEIFLKENSFLSNYAIEYIREHCKPYLQAVNNDLTHFMYRGVSNNAVDNAKLTGIEDVLITNGHYQNRIPTDTRVSSHKLANQFFVKKFGVPFRNGIFTTNSSITAREYGAQVVIIIPIGDFKFCWSPKVVDMLSITPGERGSLDDNEFLKKLEQSYQNTDLPAALTSKNEIMIYCDKCLMIPTGQKPRTQTKKEVEDTFNDDDWDDY